MSDEPNLLFDLEGQVVCMECMLKPDHQWPKDSFAQSIDPSERDPEDPPLQCSCCGWQY